MTSRSWSAPPPQGRRTVGHRPDAGPRRGRRAGDLEPGSARRDGQRGRAEGASALRPCAAAMVGDHTVVFAAEGERIELTHRADEPRFSRSARSALRCGHTARRPGSTRCRMCWASAKSLTRTPPERPRIGRTATPPPPDLLCLFYATDWPRVPEDLPGTANSSEERHRDEQCWGVLGQRTAQCCCCISK